MMPLCFEEAVMAARDESKADDWRQAIRRQGGSGLSVRAWCGRHGVPEASFYWWRRRLGQSGAAGPPSRRRRVKASPFVPARITADPFVPVRVTADPFVPARVTADPFVPVRVTADPAGPAQHRPGYIEILLSGERRVRLFGPVDRQALAGVLAVLHAGDAETGDPAGDREAAAC
jgi:hypothetical protein